MLQKIQSTKANHCVLEGCYSVSDNVIPPSLLLEIRVITKISLVEVVCSMHNVCTYSL